MQATIGRARKGWRPGRTRVSGRGVTFTTSRQRLAAQQRPRRAKCAAAVRWSGVIPDADSDAGAGGACVEGATEAHATIHALKAAKCSENTKKCTRLEGSGNTREGTGKQRQDNERHRNALVARQGKARRGGSGKTRKGTERQWQDKGRRGKAVARQGKARRGSGKTRKGTCVEKTAEQQSPGNGRHC